MSAVEALGDPRGPETIRYRLTRGQWFWRMSPLIVAMGLQLALHLEIALKRLPPQQLSPAEQHDLDIGYAVSIGTFIVACLMSVAAVRRLGVTLTPTEACVQTLRRRCIPWSDIQGIAIENLLGGRTIVLLEASGRRTKLRAPSTGPLLWDRRFEEKYHTIGQWWLAHRGPDWTPVPPRRQ